MKSDYAKARRIATIRERRCEHALIEATRALSARELEAKRAENALKGRQQDCDDARSAFFSDPSDEHARIWAMTTDKRQHAAMEANSHAKSKQAEAHERSMQCRREYEKSHERALILERAETRACITAMLRAEEREQEDSQEQRQ